MRSRFTHRRRFGAVALGVAAASAVLATSVLAGGAALSGRITADGSSTVGPYVIAAAEGFQKKNKGVQVTVGISGTGGGFERFCRGEIDLANASRPIKQSGSEVPLCLQNGVKYVAFTVANDGIAIVANKSATWVNCLTTAELKKIWDTGSKVDNWKDVRAGFPDVSAEALRPGHGLGHVRLLHREDQRQGEAEPVELHAERERQRARPGRLGRARRPRLLRPLLLRGEHRTS